MTDDSSWDKKMALKLVNEGLSWEHATLVVGIIAEEKQMADLKGYKRGYEDGFASGQWDLIE